MNTTLSVSVSVTTLIELYLADKQLAWAPTTLKSERHRLNAAAPMLTGNPMDLWNSLQEHGAYGRQTIWTRVSDFIQWCIDNGHMQGGNPYRAFRQKNARQFKNVYKRTTPEISYNEAQSRIASIKDVAVRNYAAELLATGMRTAERKTCDASGNIIGKGNKQRRVYGLDAFDGNNSVGYQQLRRALAKVGLKPHQLRKLFCTRLVEEGANEFELCKIMGWESIATASSYVKANDERIQQLVAKVQGVNNESSTANTRLRRSN